MQKIYLNRKLLQGHFWDGDLRDVQSALGASPSVTRWIKKHKTEEVMGELRIMTRANTQKVCFPIGDFVIEIEPIDK